MDTFSQRRDDKYFTRILLLIICDQYSVGIIIIVHAGGIRYNIGTRTPIVGKGSQDTRATRSTTTDDVGAY